MNIQEATKLAVKQDKFIKRSTANHWKAVKVLPTDDNYRLCVAYCEEGYFDKMPAPARGWQPGAEDLMADDWIVVD